MEVYLVGGAIRDQLLGFPVKERDWVVVGATPSEMIRLGYRQVGKEFPVFLHPQTHEEYALARTERKIKPGYTGFTVDIEPSVTLEQDLLRRDLTINAIAQTITGQLIDPYGGQRDLRAKILRHVSPAFLEDPVRILRISRFLARYAILGFRIAAETLTLMRKMVAAGEMNALVPERVWKELERALAEPHPEKFFMTLRKCHALPLLFPEMMQSYPIMLQALSAAIPLSMHPTVRLAALLHTLSPSHIEGLSQRYRFPNQYRQLMLLTVKYYTKAFLSIKITRADLLLEFLTRIDSHRRESRFHDFLLTCQAIANAMHYPFKYRPLLTAATIIKSVTVEQCHPSKHSGLALYTVLQVAKEKKLANWLATFQWTTFT